MTQTLSNLLVHAVFHKGASAPSVSSEHQPLLNQHIVAACVHLGCRCLIANGPGDHEHLLLVLSTDVSLASVVKEVKRTSTRLLKEIDAARYHAFHWQQGYGAFSVSPRHRDDVYQYILHQAEHHRRQATDVEFEALLRNAGVEKYQREFYWSEE